MNSLDFDFAYGFSGAPFACNDRNEVLYASAGGVAKIGIAAGSKQQFWIPGDGTHKISAIAIHPQSKAIVVAERRLKASILVFSEDGKPIQKINDAGRLEIAQIAFSRDGSRMVTLSGAPNHSISIYLCEPNGRMSLICNQRQANDHKFTDVSFNPRNPSELCASGGGHVCFLKHDRANNALVPLDGRVMAKNIRLTCHVYTPETILVGSRSGQIFAFDSSTGIGQLRGDTGKETPIVNMFLTRHHIVTVSEDGAIRFFTPDATDCLKTIFAPTLSGVYSASFLNDWTGMILSCAEGVVHVDLPSYEKPMLRPDDFNALVERCVVLHEGCASVVGAAFTGVDSLLAEVASNGVMRIIDINHNRIEAKVHVGSTPSAVVGDTTTAQVYVASNLGELRVYSLANRSNPQLIMKDKISEQPIHRAILNATLKLLVLLAGNRQMILVSIQDASRPQVVGVVNVPEALDTINDVVIVPEVTPPSLILATQNSAIVHLKLPNSDTPIDATLTITYEDLWVNSWRLELPFRRLAFGAAHGDNNFVMFGASVDRETKYVSCDRTAAPERRERETKALKTPVVFKDHDKVPSFVTIVNRKYLVTAGTDGKIAMRDVSACLVPSPNLRDPRKDTVSHAARHVSDCGGVVTCGFNADADRFATVGGDGSVILWAFGQTPVASHSSLILLGKAELTPCADEKHFFLEKRRLQEEEIERIKGEEKRNEVKNRVAILADRLKEIREENSRAEPDEKVDLEEFLVDRDRSKYDHNRNKSVEDMKRTVHLKDVRCDYVTDVLKKECWDTMAVKQTQVDAMRTNNLTVNNFGLRTNEKKDLTILRKLKFLRRVEEKHREMANLPKDLTDLVEEKPGETPEEAAAAAAAAEQAKAIPEFDPTKEVEEEALEDVTPFLYDPLLLFTRNRAVMQIAFLNARNLYLKTGFNKSFNELVSKKKMLIDVMNERNARCRLIQKELDDHRDLFAACINKSEQAELLINVDDSEVPAEKTHDPTYKAQLAAEEAEKERWRRVHGTDDSSDRALKAWMDGRLEKEIKVLAVRLDPPDFTDESNEAKYVPPEERTDDHNRIIRDYEKKLAKLTEEVNNRRRQLTQELETLQKENVKGAQQFDASVQQLLMARLMTAQRCYELDLQRTKLLQGIVFFKDRSAVLGKLEKQRLLLSDKVVTADQVASRFHSELESAQHEFTELETSEARKKSDKNLKSVYPFSESDELHKWYLQQLAHRKRDRRGGQNRGRDQQEKKVTAKKVEPVPTMDPWAFLEEEARAKTAQAQEEQTQALTVNFVKPEFIAEHVWDLFIKYLEERQLAERQLRKMKEEIEEMTVEEQVLIARKDELREQASRALEERDQFLKASLRESYDVDQLHIFRQGQVEVEQAPVVTDYFDAILIDANRVTALNEQIITRGRAKAEKMKEAFEKEREILIINWEIEGLSYDMDTVRSETKQLQTLRVTKHMQEFINGGGDDHNEKQRAKLHAKIDHVRSSMATKIEERKTHMQKIKRSTREREMENHLLLDQVSEAEALVQSRKQIFDLQSSEMEKERNDKLMRDMRVTRKLEDVALAQQDEMKALKAEIDKLRARTFPSFAVVSKRVMGNPDEM